MKDTSQVTAILYYDFDPGEETAIALAREYKKVYLYSPWEKDLPTLDDFLSGWGIPNVERIYSFWEYVDEADLVIFAGLYRHDLQEHLRSMGKAVWGMGEAEFLETDRLYARQYLEAAGLPQAPMKQVEGLDGLWDALKDEQDTKHVKLLWPPCRGDWETYTHTKPSTTELHIDQKKATYGMKKRGLVKFGIEDHIDGIETGGDLWTVDGATPHYCGWGFEKKDDGYIGKIDLYADIPAAIKGTIDALLPEFKRCRSRGFFATENRVTKDGKSYPIDLTMRPPCPPIESFLEVFIDPGKMIWLGANGVTYIPKLRARYYCEAMVYSSATETDWLEVIVPPENRRWFKLHNFCVLEGKYYVIPSKGQEVVGCAVGIGNTMQEAWTKMEKVVESVDCPNKEVHLNFDGVMKLIDEAHKMGIDFK